MPRHKSFPVEYDLTCQHCARDIPTTHGVYKRSINYKKAKSGEKSVFCSKSCGLAHRHGTLSQKEKEAYRQKIATTRKSRTPEQKEASRKKIQNTFASFSAEKRQDIRRRTEATFQSNGSAELHWKRIEETLIKKYGEDYGIKRAEAASKTMRKKYKVPNALCKNSPFREQAHQTNLALYGDRIASRTPKIRDKIVETYTLRHGGMGLASESAALKQRRKMKDKYGAQNAAQVPEIHARAVRSFKENGGKEKSLRTKEANGTTPREVAYKGHATKKANGSYKTNAQELYILEKLRSLFPEIEYEYLGTAHGYPGRADFYDPVSDTFFEYQGYFTHGTEPFNPNCDAHQMQLQELRANKGWAAQTTIKIWVYVDPKKRRMVKKHNLNFIEWFSIAEFEEWFAWISNPKKSKQRKSKS